MEVIFCLSLILYAGFYAWKPPDLGTRVAQSDVRLGPGKFFAKPSAKPLGRLAHLMTP